MFATGVVGTANAVTGGWGNCGGGFTILVMGLLYEALRDGGLSDEQAWRRAFFAPGAAVLAVAAAMRVSADECPRGTLDDAAAAGARAKVTVAASTRGGFANANSWILGVQYAACFGVELHVNNAMAMYFYDRYGLSVGTAGTLASLFGWMNLFARGLGGLASDAANRKLGMRGRLLVHTAYLFAEGAILVAFSYVDALAPAVAALVCFSICVQAAEGTTFAIVPYVAPKSLGAVAGVVGAGGNVGAVAWGLLFMFGSDGAAGYRALGAIIVASSFLSVFIRIDGEGSLFSNDDKKAPDPAPGRDAEA
jgi:NNP family nitrate/nitrite transporter-like MFS transporter